MSLPLVSLRLLWKSEVGTFAMFPSLKSIVLLWLFSSPFFAAHAEMSLIMLASTIEGRLAAVWPMPTPHCFLLARMSCSSSWERERATDTEAAVSLVVRGTSCRGRDKRRFSVQCVRKQASVTHSRENLEPAAHASERAALACREVKLLQSQPLVGSC